MSSLANTSSRQCPSRVPGPPTFASGTLLGRAPGPSSAPYSRVAFLPVNSGSGPPAPMIRSRRSKIVPKPSTWPISWTMTLTRLPSLSICSRSALSKAMTPVAGMKLPGRRSIGPARPMIDPGPSIRSPVASMRTSSIVSPSMTTAGTSALMI